MVPAAQAQQHSSNNKHAAAPACPAKPTHLVQPTACWRHTTAALAGPCLQQQERICSSRPQFGSGWEQGMQAVRPALCTQQVQAGSAAMLCYNYAAASMASKRAHLPPLPLTVPVLLPAQPAYVVATVGKPKTPSLRSRAHAPAQLLLTRSGGSKQIGAHDQAGPLASAAATRNTNLCSGRLAAIHRPSGNNCSSST